ncbi:PQQ-like beta-propeller repeat protein [Roseobacter sp.]|uniref:PQQ-like beta-propeller repeat protein n=1 Tax=Roseobacter sp. TaxID=1907202 RepID=UPI0025DE2824|nr:PQQ-like beta-propeller repeat protein [Roseobacter sp.]
MVHEGMTAKLWNTGAVNAPRAGLAALVACVFLTGCGGDDVILPGIREDIRAPEETLAPEVTENTTRAISLPAQQANAQWPQSAGTPAFRTAHAALGTAPTRIWTANIGKGDSRRQRITAAPVVAQGIIFTLDAEAQVTATSVSGQQVWQKDLLPARENSGDATGGGLAWKDGKLFVSLGYGALVAVDAANGDVLWRQRLEGTGSGTPTAIGGLVYVTAGDDQGWAISDDDGRIVWQLQASPDVNNVLGAPAPAVSDDLAIFGFGSGEIQAVFRRGGLRRWDASVLGERAGRSASNVGDVTAAPVISGNRVYVGNQSGRLVALNLGSGERIWTAREGAVGSVVPAGDSVFALSDLGELLRIDASTGARIWGAQLATFVKDRPRRKAEIVAHHGPLLAGGRIYVASNDGFLRSFDPASGALTGTVEIPDGATSAPVVAGGVLYVVSTDGQLHAFR